MPVPQGTPTIRVFDEDMIRFWEFAGWSSANDGLARPRAEAKTLSMWCGASYVVKSTRCNLCALCGAEC
eukprot:5168059-Pyramimonas_sp.AAC.1